MSESKGPKPTVEMEDGTPRDEGAKASVAPEEAGTAGKPAASAKDGEGTTGGGAHPFRHARESAGDWLRENFPGHENAVFGGLCGLVIAVLVFAIGFWQTLFITVCVVIGVAIGQYADGNPTVVKVFRSLFGGRD